MNYLTGYFGIPGRCGGKVHVIKGQKPICGYSPHVLSEFQWCSHGIQYRLIECEGCKNRAAKILEREAFDMLVRIEMDQQRRRKRLPSRMPPMYNRLDIYDEAL